MACSSVFAKGPVLVYSAQDDSTWLFFPLTGAMTSNGIDKVRLALELENKAGSIQLQPALQYSDDGVNWDTAVYVGDTQTTTERTTNGTTYESGFSNVPSGAKTFVRFGVRVKNSSGTGVAMGLASLRVETRSA